MDYRFATPEDTPLILYFIKELASYEKMLDEVVADEATLREWIFIDFYLSLGAEPMKDWTVYRISGDTLQELAKG